MHRHGFAHSIAHAGIRMITFLTLLAIGGCAILTDSQVKEVQRFADTSRAYTTLPGALASAYGTLVKDVRLLEASTLPAPKAWGAVQEAYHHAERMRDLGKQMDTALGVLDDYSELLTELVSDAYSDALAKSAETLAKSADKGISFYNDTYLSDKAPKDQIPAYGGEVAQVIRTAGGLYIRTRQATALRGAIAKADPTIQRMMLEVQRLGQDIKHDFASKEGDYRTTFEHFAGRPSLDSIHRSYDALAQSANGQALADRVGAAARAFAAAHTALRAKTAVRLTLSEAIAEIDALRAEIDAGKVLRKKLEKAQ